MKIKLYDIFSHWNKNVIWVFSDPHFDDVDCKSMAPDWPSPEEQIKLINKCVSKNDTIIFLGDIGNEEYIKQIKGYKVLITGNHDKGVSNYKKKFIAAGHVNKKFQTFFDWKNSKEEVMELIDEYNHEHPWLPFLIKDNKMFDEVYEGPLFISNKILLSHEPVNINFGYNIHGHNHSGVHTTIGKDKNIMHINVAADVIKYIPVRLDKLLEYGKVSDIHRLAIDKAKENS